MENNNMRICEFIVENGIKLLKKNKINKLNILMLQNMINIELDNNMYIITNMISYKRFIDIISNDYKIILKYIPNINERNNLFESINVVYLKHNQVNICIENIFIANKNVV